MNFSQVTDWVIPQGNVVRVTDSLNRVIWEKTHDYSQDYFFVEDASGQANTLNFAGASTSPSIPIYISNDQQNWTYLGVVSYGNPLSTTLPANSKIYIKATTNIWYDINSTSRTGLSCSNDFNIGGNVKSLLFGDNFLSTNMTSSNDYAFGTLFMNHNKLISAENLVITDTATHAYARMFNNAKNLTKPAKITATNTSSFCYAYMYYGCDNLSEACDLPALTLTNSCYVDMFRACKNITSGQINIAATTMDVYSCQGMFRDCIALTTAPALPATTLAQSCYGNMFRGCTSLTTAPALTATTLVNYCYSDMFYNCTSLTTAPALTATTLAECCYIGMFQGCTSLTSAPALPATTLANGCYNSMFQGCTSLTTAPELPATTLADYCYWYMFQGCTSLITAPTLPATTLATECYNNMFRGCTSLTTAPELPATTLADYCYWYMFQGCTSLITAPALPATTLADYCYNNMFSGCTSLNEVTTYATDISATNCLTNWLYSVAATGDFFNLGSATYTVDSASGIPTGWTEHKTAPTAEYFYVEDTSGAANTLSITKSGSTAPTIEVFYSTDQTNWTSMGTTDTTAITATVPANSKLYLRCNTSRWGSGASKYNGINCSGNFNVGGNINSLLYGDLFNGDIEFPSNVGTYTFTKLFGSSTTLINANNLLLPATTLVNYCYNGMFSYVTSLTSAPALPATTLAQSCYYEMFYHCTSLTSAPALPATTLANGCYNSMFKECYNLTTVPASLPATTLYNECYKGMFYSCRAITVSPILPATTLVYACYQEMFRQCWNITNITTYATDISASQCLNNWLNGASSTGDFWNLGNPTPTYTRDTSGIPSGWTEHTSL